MNHSTTPRTPASQNSTARAAAAPHRGAPARHGHGVALTPLAVLIGSMLSAGAVFANPTGGQVVAGSAAISNGAPGTLNIQQSSHRAIINWQSFSIGAGETVNFLQPAASSVVLNRVLGNDPSALFGRLNANGTVMLVNPNGVVFGPTARVDVGGLVATTANIRNADFMAGRHVFDLASPNANAGVVNEGQISIHDSGLAALVAPSVRNAGVIEARLGRVALGGARSFTLDFHGDGMLSFSAGSAVDSAPAGASALVLNTGAIRADGGTVMLSAQAVKGVIDDVINTTGIVSATSVASHNGRIVLSGGGAGSVAVGGRVDASGQAAGQGGGTVTVTGDQVKVGTDARIDVSGAAGGGEIALGSTGIAGAYAGKSYSVDVAAGAQLHADAIDNGSGGHVTMWSTDRTVFNGSLSARGGAQGGDGGFAEVSSLKDIGLGGHVDLRAPHGKTGLLLLDPTDLRITDSASGGSQDGNAGDGSVAAGDASQGSGSTLNTVSRGLLEGLAGNANITLQATGQITIDAMAGGLIDLATTAGHGFTLQSTQNGGIRFVDAQTEIRTQGGSITLEALGIGSTLANIGKLSSNGGAVTLNATGDIQLAGAVNAGSGAVRVQSTVGSISNAPSATPLISGGSVNLSAAGGSIGASGSAVGTHTANLVLRAGGSIFASSDMQLASLDLTAGHLSPTVDNSYQVSATGLTFQLTDGASLGVTQVAQSGLDFTLSSDRSLLLETVSLGNGDLALTSTGGNLVGSASGLLTAGTLALTAQGSNGNNGAIGTSGQSILTAAGSAVAIAGSGGVYLANTGALALDRLSTTGNSAVSSTGTLTAGNVNAGSATLALASSGGSILDDGDAATRIGASTLNLTAGGAIGTSGTLLATSASTLSANAAAGGIHASTSATSSVMSSITSGNGAIELRTGGSTTLTSLASGTSSSANDISVTAAGTGSISVGTINAGALGDVTLATTSGSIFGNSGLITGDTVALHAAGSGSVTVRTAASHLDVQAGGSSISITQAGAVTLDRIATPGFLASVTSSSGDITVGTVSTSSSGQVTLTASAGAILDDGHSATRISTGTASLSASGAIGAPGQAVQTRATGLSASSTGDLVITNSDATLTSLALTNRHSAPGNAGTLQVDSPYLTFDVTDTGTSYTLDRLVGVPLNSLSFNGDASLVLGQVQATGSVSLTSTQGHLADDGNLNTRVTSGSTLTLSAAQGGIGSLANPVSVNAASLSATMRGDLYVTDIADLSSLTIASSHADTTTSYGMAITAPSLKFSITDSAAGHAVHTLTDNTSLTLNFTSDRDITLGRVDATSSGTVRFTSSAGAIQDDGDKSTRVLANNTTLSGRSVGADGADHLDVVTGTLAATASAGGVYVQVPMPTGSTNTTSTVTLGTVTATGPVMITAVEGDLSLGGFLTATNQSVTLTAMEGSIYSPNGYGIGIGTGSLTLDAAHAIGTSARAVPVTSSAGASLQAAAGTSMFVSASGPMALSSLDATAGITYTQSSGAITVGHVDATAGGAVSITATGGAIQDDGNGATGITGSQVTLSAAASSVGTAGSAIAVNTPQLLVTANGTVNVSDGATLDTLSLTRGSGSSGSIAISAGAGQTFTMSEDGSQHYLQDVSSSTPLAFSFSGQRAVKVGSIDVGAAGSASISSATDLVNDGQVGTSIAAGTVALTAGTAGSIGASGSGNAISLEGTTALTLSAGRNFFVASDGALADLGITSTNTTTAAGTASQFGISGLGQTFSLADSGTTQSLDFGGTALGSFSFSTRKNIEAGTVAATGDVTLSTSGGGANSNISSDSGSGRIAGNRVLLTATSSTAGGGSIGSNSRSLRVDTPTLILAGSANVYVADAQNLAGLDMTLTHGTNTTFGYDVTAGNITLGISDGNTQSLGLATSGSMDFSYSVDRGLSLATIDAGTSSTGSVSLTSRSAPTGTSPQINRGSGTVTAGRVALSAVGTNGAVGAGGTLSTNTQNLSIASGGNVSVSNATTLSSLSLDAQHRTTGSTTHTYAVSATGLTFSISDSVGTNAFQLTNITQSGLALSVKADRTITATRVNTGAGGTATLHSSSAIQGGSGANAGSPSITTGDLVLKGSSAYGYQGSTPLYTAVSTLASTLTSTLYLSNAGSLTLLANTVGSSADVASSNNSLLQGNGGLFTTPTLKLSANQSLGATGTLLTDARRLTLVSRGNVDVGNASDLYALSITSTHGTPGAQNTISVAAPRLTLALTDSVAGDQYHLGNLVDHTGLDFTLSTDVALDLGTANAQAGRSLALYSTGSGTSITNDGSSLLTAGSITLSATGSVGAAGGSGTRMQTDALGLTLITGADAYADNAQDLTSLSLTSTQNAGGSAPVYQVTAPSLSFDITDDGTTHINNVADSTGLNFTLSTRRDQAVGVIDTGRSGTVSLTSVGDILGDADSSKRIHAASASFSASNGGAVGSVANPIHLSAPLTSFSVTGALNVESDTHIDRLGITTTHPTATYGGTYSIVSVPLSGPAYQLFTATDSVTGTALTSLDDPLGLAFSFTSDRAMQVGSLDLGTTGTVALTGTGSGGILGDGNANTQVQAASLSMASLGGAVGAAGSGNGIDATVNSVSASALGGSVNLALHGRTLLGSISGTGGVHLVNDEGDIALGSINAGGSAVTIDNQGGSILSGAISNATTVSLTASGSIGNDSAIATAANGGGTTTLTASASAAHGASGSIAISESYNLNAASVTAPAAVTLSSGYGMLAGTITSGGAVSLSSSQGSINGSSSSNAITGTSVNLSARYGTGNGVGNSEVRLNLNTPQLVINTPGSVYVTDVADLNLLTLDRTNYSSTGSSGTLSVIASNLVLSATDSSNLTTFTTLTDSTGLDFSYLGIGSIAVGTMNLGSGTALLQAYLSSGDGNITAVNSSSLLTAGSATLQAYGTGSMIGSSGTALGLAVGSLTASSGTGGMFLKQAGSLNLSSLSTTGDLSVNATSGDLTLGTLSYGSAKTLTLTAGAGRILAGTGTLAGGSSSAAISLSAAHGIGTDVAPVLLNASAGHTMSASVTGSGSLYLSSLGTLNGGLTTAVNNGATVVTAAGNIKLSAMSSATDAAGNDIRVTASSGDITVTSVSGGSDASFNAVDLAANAGRIVATAGATLEGYDVRLHGATGVGSSGARVSASGQRVQVTSSGGAIYLGAAAPSVLSYVDSGGGLIDVSTTADLLIANALSGGGNIVVSAGSSGATLLAGAINAGAGSVSLSSASGAVQDDGNSDTAVAGYSVTVSGGTGIGSALQGLNTAAGTLSLASSAGGVYVADGNANGVTLGSVTAGNGPVHIVTSGDTIATSITVQTDAAGHDIVLGTSSGHLTLGSLAAGATHGTVSLTAAGSILAGGSGTHISAQAATLAAGGDIGAVTDLATGAGTPIKLNVGTITGLGSSGSSRVVSVDNAGTGALALGGGALSLGSGSSAYIQTAGDLDVSAGIALANGNLSLSAGGTLLLPTTAISTTGAVRLSGGTDIVSSAGGAAARQLQVSGSSLYLRSGAAGGSTQLTTAVISIDAALGGAGNLTVANTGTLAVAALQTASGDISATSSTGFTANSVVAGGTGRSISLTATAGDLTAGTINAGGTGSITLSAAQGALLGSSPVLTASSLDLTSGSGIGSSGSAFNLSIDNVSAQVTGTGGIYLSSGGSLALGTLSTNDGDIAVTAAGSISAGALGAGNSGNLSLTSTGGNVNLSQAYVNAGSDASRSGLHLQGQQISLAGATTSGAQTYTGALTLGGNLAAKSILVTGDATLAGGARTLATSSGDLHITGQLLGSGYAATLDAGSGAVLLDGAASNLAALAVTGGSLQTVGASTTGAQTYTGAHAMAGSYATQGGAFTQSGAAQLGGSTSIGTAGGAVSFGHGIDGAANLSIDSGAGNVSFAGAAGQATRLGSLVVNSSGATQFGGAFAAASVSTDAAGTLAVSGGSVNTTGAQSYGERLVLGADTVLAGSTVTLAQGADAATAGQQGLLISGNAVLGAALGGQAALQSLAISGSTVLNGGVVTTSGAQTYTGAVALGADATLTGQGIAFGSSLDGGVDLVVSAGAGAASFGGAVGAGTRLGNLLVNSSGATGFAGSVRAASLATDAVGTVLVDGGSIHTSGTQTYGERLVLGADTTLTGSSVTLAGGADAAGAGQQALTISGPAVLAGAFGAQQALHSFHITGTSTLADTSITTTGTQTYAGAVTLAGDAALNASTVVLQAGVDDAAAGLHGLSITGHADVAGAIGAGQALRALSVSGNTTLALGSVSTTGNQSYGGTLATADAQGLQLSGHSFRFDGAVTASQGAIGIASNSSEGTVEFARNATVQAATGFAQTGGASLRLPASLQVTMGDITIEAPASLPTGQAVITTEGDITMSGLQGAGTTLAMNAGTGVLRIGLDDGNASHKINVARLSVTTASAAELFGSVAGKGGAMAASRIDSRLVNAPYFINGTPWGPVETINVLVATTVPVGVVPSTPGAYSLFTGAVDRSGLVPNVLGVYASPQVLTIAPMLPLVAREGAPGANPAPAAARPAPAAVPAGQGSQPVEPGRGPDEDPQRPGVDER
jgi:filamentous hemagglutinin family protein